MRILWIHDGTFSVAQEKVMKSQIAKLGVNVANVFLFNPERGHGDVLKLKPKTKAKLILDEAVAKATLERISEYANRIKATVIAINSISALALFTKEQSALGTYAGSVFRLGDLPVIVIDAIPTIRTLNHGAWRMVLLLSKMLRWGSGKQNPEPKFDYKLVQSVEDLHEFRQWVQDAAFIAEDLETAHRLITCAGFTILKENGEMRTFVIPFYNTMEPDGCYWSSAEIEAMAWEVIKFANSSPAYKIFQNGSYDCAYLVRYNVPPVNYFLDPMHMMHSLWIESPKDLGFITSLFVDHSRYWKNEIKGEGAARKAGDRVPRTQRGIEMYWRYCGLDCHNTMLNAFRLLELMTGNKKLREYGIENYKKEIALQLGPIFLMCMHGLRTLNSRRNEKIRMWSEDAQKGLETLRRMVGSKTWRPTPANVAILLFDTWKVVPAEVRKGRTRSVTRSTDEKLLKLYRDQHPLFAKLIDQIWEAKKPEANISKYGQPSLTLYNRFLYSYSAAGTDTWRLAGRDHQFYAGTNPQNVPKDVRDMFVADPGYVFVEQDYSQSDAYFVAFEHEEEKMIDIMLSPDDTHCRHAEFFFKKKYEDLVAGWKANEDWVVHPTKGVRQNTKRVAHGANYEMAANTMLVTMGREAVRGTAVALGVPENAAATLNDKQLVKICNFLLEQYHQLYPGLRPSLMAKRMEVARNGNRVTTYGGFHRVFFGSVTDDPAIQRKLAAQFGQSGTAGNINLALLDLYYRSDALKMGVKFLAQTHDSLLYMVPVGILHEGIAEVTKYLERECEINGRKFVVPTEADVGLHWGKGMTGYKPTITIEDLVEKEVEYIKKKYPNNWEAQLEEMDLQRWLDAKRFHDEKMKGVA